MEGKRTLFLFTIEYPYGTGESFVENELKLLAEKFQTIYLFPLKTQGTARRLPATSIKVISLFSKQQTNTRRVSCKNLLLFVQILISEFYFSKQHLKFLIQLRKFRSVLLVNSYRARVLEKFIADSEDQHILYYSFWTDDWATVLSILKAKKIIDGFVSRVHGYDLYEERWPGQIIPFRNFQLKSVSRIITASRDGLNYLKIHHSEYGQKFFLKHLNVFDNGSNPFIRNNEFVVVSCANVSPLKRVHLIPPLLKQLKFSIRWIHFGTGEELDNLKKEIQLLPDTIRVELKGHVKNEELIRFYQEQKVNLFIHLSETEGGVPLVLQEAASFGIPLLGTNIGGIPEIVTKETGILVPVNFNNTDVANQIMNLESDSFDVLAFRKGVKAYWNEHFNANLNKDKLYNLLIN